MLLKGVSVKNDILDSYWDISKDILMFFKSEICEGYMKK